MDDFEERLEGVYPAVERYVKYRLEGGSDAEDLIQDICLTAYLKYDQLQKKRILPGMDSEHCPEPLP